MDTPFTAPDGFPGIDPHATPAYDLAADHAPARRVPSRGEVVAFRRKEETGLPFELRATLPGFEATVKKLTLADRAQTGALPQAMQDRIVGVIDRGSRGGGDRRITSSKYLRSLGDNEELANCLCLVGFVSPRLVETEDELTDDAWLLADVDLRDRLAYSSYVLGNDETAAGRLKRDAYNPG